MVDKQFNYDLCEERHGFIKGAFGDMNNRIKKVENRFLVIMTTLVINLLGVICTLGVLLTHAK